MPRMRGISEKIVYGFNPLPAGIKEVDLLKAAGLDMIVPATTDPFYVSWRYGGTLHREYGRMEPGDFLGLRESEGVEFMTDNRDIGCVIVDDPTDPVEVCEKAILGLQTAVMFWKERGAKRVFEWRKTHNVSKDDLEDHKYDLWSYYVNEEKANVCYAELEKRRKELAGYAHEEITEE